MKFEVSVDGSALRNSTEVADDVAVNRTVNSCQLRVVVPVPCVFSAASNCVPFTKTSTVLVVPKIPSGLTTLPTQNDN